MFSKDELEKELDDLYERLNSYEDYNKYIDASQNLNILISEVQNTFEKYFNSLSKDEVQKRTKILNESYSFEAQLALDKYKLKSIELRAFDYVRQVNLFEFLYKKLK